MSADVPRFANTEEAERYGRDLWRVIGPDDFQTLIRTWITAQLAFDNATNPQSRANLAFRVQTLREAVQAFLFPPSAPVAAGVSPANPPPSLRPTRPPLQREQEHEQEVVALEGCS